MESAFWSGFRLDSFVFKNLDITSPQGLAGVCVITLAIAFVFEATRTFRDWLYVEFLKKRSCHGTTGRESPLGLELHENNGNTLEKKESNGGTRNGNATEPSVPASPSRAPVIAAGTLSGSGKSCRRPGFQVGLLELSISTVFHVCQVVLGYVLMLVVMSFNVWIFLAVILGTTLGFFVFDSFNRKIHALKQGAGTSNNK